MRTALVLFCVFAVPHASAAPDIGAVTSERPEVGTTAPPQAATYGLCGAPQNADDPRATLGEKGDLLVHAKLCAEYLARALGGIGAQASVHRVGRVLPQQRDPQIHHGSQVVRRCGANDECALGARRHRVGS